MVLLLFAVFGQVFAFSGAKASHLFNAFRTENVPASPAAVTASRTSGGFFSLIFPGSRGAFACILTDSWERSDVT